MTEADERIIARKDTDLESIEYGTPTKGGGKMYLNTRTDDIGGIRIRIALHAEALKLFKERILKAQDTQ